MEYDLFMELLFRLMGQVHRFLKWIMATNKRFLFLTNNSQHTPLQLQQRLRKMGLDVPKSAFFTSALSTANFLISQRPHGCTAYCVGGAGIKEALTDVGVQLTDDNPEYVVIGESEEYTVAEFTVATNLVHKGAKLIGTNIDASDPVEGGIAPSCGAWVALVEAATKKRAYFLGKPNPWMIRSALSRLGCHSAESAIVGDRMDTDIIAGIESGLSPILVLSGVTAENEIEQWPYTYDSPCVPN